MCSSYDLPVFTHVLVAPDYIHAHVYIRPVITRRYIICCWRCWDYCIISRSILFLRICRVLSFCWIITTHIPLSPPSSPLYQIYFMTSPRASDSPSPNSSSPSNTSELSRSVPQINVRPPGQSITDQVKPLRQDQFWISKFNSIYFKINSAPELITHHQNLPIVVLYYNRNPGLRRLV